jgi:hypothetical protein
MLERDRNRIRTSEIKYIKIDEDCTRTDQLGNEGTRNELNILPLHCCMRAESRNSGTRRGGH